MTVIVNRETPLHRDDGASISHYDLLFSAGVHNQAELRLPDVGTVLDYDPGTVVLLAGRAVAHSVPRSWAGDRICWAHYMKDKVHDRCGIPQPELVNLEFYNAFKDHGYRLRVDKLQA
jgi:hypothetical protein